jgi:hypothetical protein
MKSSYREIKALKAPTEMADSAAELEFGDSKCDGQKRGIYHN